MNDVIQVLNGLGVEQKTITVGFLNHYGYLSQLAQLGTNHKIHVEGADYHVRIDKAVKLSVQHGHLRVNDVFKPDILLSYKTQGKQSYDMTINALADDIPVHHVTRYPKSLQQLLFNKYMQRYITTDNVNNIKFKPLKVMASNTYLSHTLSLNPDAMEHAHRWICKPEFGAMSNDVFAIDGNHVNIPLLLNRFSKERNEKSHRKNIKNLERLIEGKYMELANGGKIHDINFNEYYNGQLMAQEYIYATHEYRIIKKDIFKYDVYRRLKLNNNSYPYNDDLIYSYPICSINIGELDELGYLHTGGQTLHPIEQSVFNSEAFVNMLKCFSSPELQFEFGSIDFFINNVNTDEVKIGIYEFQPQYGVIDVYPEILEEYIKNILTYLIKTYLIGESNDSKCEQTA